MRTESLSDAILAIYEAALASDGWFKALRHVADFSGSAGCRIVIRNNSGGPVIYSVEEGIEHYSAGARIEMLGSARPANRQPIPIGEPIVCNATTGQTIIAGSGEPWQKQDPREVLTIVLLNSLEGSLILEAMRTEQQGCYTERELERMRMISPHLCRAIRISDSLNLSRWTSELLEASLEALSTGVYFIGRQNRVVYLNRQAREQVRSGKVLRLIDDHLDAADRGTQKLLQAELRRIECDCELEDRSGCALALADGAGSGYVAHVLPLRGARQSRIARHFAAFAVIFVQDPATAPALANAAFARLYGLTDGELRLLNGLMPGLSLAEAARPLGISEATAKTHLRRIFAKTRTSKQAELLYLLMTSTPPTIAARADLSCKRLPEDYV
jgi:DNA-binding CsgD family transcriptional regulator